MNMVSLNDCKKKLQDLTHKQLVDFTLALIKLKADNKSFAHYKLFIEGVNDDAFIDDYKAYFNDEIKYLLTLNYWGFGKAITKNYRYLLKYSKPVKNPEINFALFFHFCYQLDKYHIELSKISHQWKRLFINAFKKCYTNILKMHEDLQYDKLKQLEKLNLWEEMQEYMQ